MVVATQYLCVGFCGKGLILNRHPIYYTGD